MEHPFNIQVILAIIFFFLPLAFKVRKNQSVEISDLAKCTLTAMGLPSLAICLFYLVTNPVKAMEMTEAVQYLTIAVLIIIYLSAVEIK